MLGQLETFPSLGAVSGWELQWWNASGFAYHGLKSKQILSCDAGGAGDVAGAGAHEHSASISLLPGFCPSHASAPHLCLCPSSPTSYQLFLQQL